MLSGNWGKKQNYWAADTADLEIGQDMQDALDEEEAAKDLQKKRLKSINAEDFAMSDSDSNDDDDSQSESESEEIAPSSGHLSGISIGREKVSTLFCVSFDVFLT
jgi:hypothetical protein